MYKFNMILLILALSAPAFADCDDAKRKCQNECSGSLEVDGREIDTSSTDFESNCEDACKSGARSCEDEESRSSGCDDFKRKCKRECPSSIYIYYSSEGFESGYTYDSNASSLCEEACDSGYRRCE